MTASIDRHPDQFFRDVVVPHQDDCDVCQRVISSYEEGGVLALFHLGKSEEEIESIQKDAALLEAGSWAPINLDELGSEEKSLLEEKLQRFHDGYFWPIERHRCLDHCSKLRRLYDEHKAAH